MIFVPVDRSDFAWNICLSPAVPADRCCSLDQQPPVSESRDPELSLCSSRYSRRAMDEGVSYIEGSDSSFVKERISPANTCESLGRTAYDHRDLVRVHFCTSRTSRRSLCLWHGHIIYGRSTLLLQWSRKLHRPVLDSHRYPDSISGSGQQMARQGLFKRSNRAITTAQRHFGIIHVVRRQYYHVGLVYVL